MRGGIPDRGPRPRFGSILNERGHPGPSEFEEHIQNEGGVQQQVHRGLLGSILNERRYPGPCGHLPYLVVSKMSVTFWIKWLSPIFGSIKGGVSRTMGPSPLSGSIPNEGGIPDHGAIPLYLILSKMRDGNPDPGDVPPIWVYQKLGFKTTSQRQDTFSSILK